MPNDHDKLDALMKRARQQETMTDWMPFISRAMNRRAMGIAMGVSGSDLGAEAGVQAAGKLAKAAKAATKEPYDIFKGLRPDAEVRNLWGDIQKLWGQVKKAQQLGLHHQAEQIMPILQRAQEDALTNSTKAEVVDKMLTKDTSGNIKTLGMARPGKATPEMLKENHGRVLDALDTLGNQISRMEELQGIAKKAEAKPQVFKTPEEWMAANKPQPPPKAVSEPPAPQAASQPTEAPKPPQIIENPHTVEVEHDQIPDLEAKLKSVAKDLSAEQKSKLAKWAKMTTRPAMKEHTQAIERALELQKNPSSEIPGEKDLLRLILRDTDYKI